jgi:hypothetical protein
MSSTVYDPGIHRPGKRKEPFALGIIMKDNFTDHTQHAISKYLMTYIYILLLRKTARLLGGGEEFLVHASVQARSGKGKGGTEGSHILLREVSFGGTYVYDLAQIPQGLKSALVYCAAQVTVTPGSYNRMDQLLEEPEPTLSSYLSLVRHACRAEADTLLFRGALFDDICRLFQFAIANGDTYAQAPTTAQGQKSGARHLAEYTLELARFRSLRATIIQRDTEDWMYAIRVDGGWEVKNKQSWESIRNRIYLSDV